MRQELFNGLVIDPSALKGYRKHGAYAVVQYYVFNSNYPIYCLLFKYSET